jgi:arginase
VVPPGRYAPETTPGSLRNQAAIIDHSRRLAERIEQVRADGPFPLVLGGDCGILVGAGIALRRSHWPGTATG